MPVISSVQDFFPFVSENTVAMSLGGSILSGATTVPVSGMSNYSNGETVVFTVDAPTAALKQVFTGQVSGSSVVNVVWTYGTNQPHSNGAPVIDYVSATTMSMVSAGIQKQHNQNGTHQAITNTGGLTTDTLLATGNATVDGTLSVVGATTITGVTHLNGGATVNSNPVWQYLGYAQITGNFTLSSSQTVATQVTGLSSTVTIPASATKVKITAFSYALVGATAGDILSFLIWDGAVGVGTTVGGWNTTVPTSGNAGGAIPITIVPPVTGAKTYNVSVNSNNAHNVVVDASSTLPAYILVECC